MLTGLWRGAKHYQGKSADYHYQNCSFCLKFACLYHFFAATQKDFALFLYLCGKLDKQETKRKNPIRRCI